MMIGLTALLQLRISKFRTDKRVVSRNVSAINGNWQLSNNAKATFGVTPNQENLVCIRSDWTGLTECKSEKSNRTENNRLITKNKSQW